MSESPRASVIINNYNYGRFIGEAIESALGQTYENTEVIVVDDGSTDESRDVIRSFGDQVKPVYKENGGQGSAYNSGFLDSDGEVVCFLDADDSLFPNAIQSAVALMHDPDVVKIQWPLRVVDAAGKWQGKLSTTVAAPAGDLLERVISDGPLYDFHFTTGAAYRRSFLQSVFPVPEPPYRNGGDVYLITLAPLFGIIRNAELALGTYRAHGSNNYRDRPLDDERIRDCIRRFNTNASVLQQQLSRRGVRPDMGQWKERNFNYLWPHRLLLAKRDIESLIPRGSSYILVNGNEWGSDEPVAGRTFVPFLERNGEYWGPPKNDDDALSELDRMHRAGAAFVVIWWTAFWWLDAFPVFRERLFSQARRVLDNDRLIVFELLPHHIHA